MLIFHKHHNSNWNNGFASNNAILNITPYKPEVLFIGTFNPDIAGNFSDFYYGRNYFWPAFKNMFVLKVIALLNRRIPSALRKQPPPPTLNPSLEEIFEICRNLKLTFADLIYSVNDPGNEYNLISDDHLARLDLQSKIGWNTENIIKYICDNPSIKCIYFTRQPTGIWKKEWQKILTHSCIKGRLITHIYTPSGSSLKGKPRMEVLINHWINNSDPNYGRLTTSCLPIPKLTFNIKY